MSHFVTTNYRRKRNSLLVALLLTLWVLVLIIYTTKPTSSSPTQHPTMATAKQGTNKEASSHSHSQDTAQRHQRRQRHHAHHHPTNTTGGAHHDMKPDEHTIFIEEMPLEEWNTVNEGDKSSISVSYPEYFQDAVEDELGPFLFDALYDPLVFSDVVGDGGEKQGSSQSLSGDPEPSIARQLLYLKRFFSHTLGRMHRDLRLQELYERYRFDAIRQIKNTINAAQAASQIEDFAAFNRALRQLILGHLKQLVSCVQLVMNANGGNSTSYLRDLWYQRRDLYHGHDPVWVLMREFSTDTSMEAADVLLNGLRHVKVQEEQRSGGKRPQSKRATQAAASQAQLHPTELLNPLSYNEVTAGNDGSGSNDDDISLFVKKDTLPAFVTCTAMHTACTDPACLPYCNLDYLQQASADSKGSRIDRRSFSPASVAQDQHRAAPFFHRMLRLSDAADTFEFEMQQSALWDSQHNATRNTFWSTMTMSCANVSGVLLGGQCQEVDEDEGVLRKANMGWAKVVGLCASRKATVVQRLEDDAPSSSSHASHSSSGAAVIGYIPFKALKSHIKQAELNDEINMFVLPQSGAQGNGIGDDVVTRVFRRYSKTHGATAPNPRSRVFDEVSILRLDLDGAGEVLHEWLSTELKSLGSRETIQRALASERKHHSHHKGSAVRGDHEEEEDDDAAQWTMINFPSETSDALFTVSQVAVQIPLDGTRQTTWNLFRQLDLLQILNRLGFVMVSSDTSTRCDPSARFAEMTFVHYSHFIKSEVWADQQRRYHPHHHRRHT